MPQRKFRIGQTVGYHSKSDRQNATPGHYLVTQFLPAQNGRELEYQIRNIEDGKEVAVRESELRTT